MLVSIFGFNYEYDYQSKVILAVASLQVIGCLYSCYKINFLGKFYMYQSMRRGAGRLIKVVPS